MSVLRDILRVLTAQRRARQPRFRPEESTLVLLPATYAQLLTEDGTAEERRVVSRVGPDQEVRILDVPVVVGEVPEDWGWMLQWRGRLAPAAGEEGG